MTKAFIFDFDGTLVDSEQAIYQCFQSITKQLAPERIDYTKNILIGPPLRDTASEILGPNHQDSLDEFVQLFSSIIRDQSLANLDIYRAVIDYESISGTYDSTYVQTIAEWDNIRTPVNYIMTKQSGDWKITDMSIDDVFTAESYNRQFQRIIASRGFGYLMETLRRRAERNS